MTTLRVVADLWRDQQLSWRLRTQAVGSETPSGASLKVSATACAAQDSASGGMGEAYGVAGTKTDPLWDWTVGLLGLGQLDLGSEGLVGLAGSLVCCSQVGYRGVARTGMAAVVGLSMSTRKSVAAMELSISELGSRAQG